MRYEKTKTGIVFYDEKVIAKYFPDTSGKLRTTQGLTKRQLFYIADIIKIKFDNVINYS